MKILKYLLLSLFLKTSFTLQGQDIKQFFNESNSFFNTYTQQGKVDYKKIKQNLEGLDKILKNAESVAIANQNATHQQAFWINAYNLLVIKGIIDNYPINSPLDKSGFFDKITYLVAGEKLTLNDIENKKLRKQFNDPRFHFVLVCGALGCPPIINRAYMPSTLEQQLQEQTVLALNNPEFIKVSKNKVAVSEIFKWYKEDFVSQGTEIDFLNKYLNEKIPTSSKLSYYTYNWNLNEK